MSTAVIIIAEDLHNERAGYYRAFNATHQGDTIMSPCIGYCSPGGSHRTVRATYEEIRRHDRTTPIFRLGKLLLYKNGKMIKM